MKLGWGVLTSGNLGDYAILSTVAHPNSSAEQSIGRVQRGSSKRGECIEHRRTELCVSQHAHAGYDVCDGEEGLPEEEILVTTEESWPSYR